MPKACPALELAAERFLDGELGPARKREFIRRLKKDKRLATLVDELRSARHALQILKKTVPPSAGFAAMRRILFKAIQEM